MTWPADCAGDRRAVDGELVVRVRWCHLAVPYDVASARCDSTSLAQQVPQLGRASAANSGDVRTSADRGRSNGTFFDAMMRPGRADMTSTRSPRRIASSRLWVMKRRCDDRPATARAARPGGRGASVRRGRRTARPSSRISGSTASARAIATRCFMPPDKRVRVRLLTVARPSFVRYARRTLVALLLLDAREVEAEADVVEHALPRVDRVVLEDHRGRLLAVRTRQRRSRLRWDGSARRPCAGTSTCRSPTGRRCTRTRRRRCRGRAGRARAPAPCRRRSTARPRAPRSSRLRRWARHPVPLAPPGSAPATARRSPYPLAATVKHGSDA